MSRRVLCKVYVDGDKTSLEFRRAPRVGEQVQVQGYPDLYRVDKVRHEPVQPMSEWEAIIKVWLEPADTDGS